MKTPVNARARDRSPPLHRCSSTASFWTRASSISHASRELGQACECGSRFEHPPQKYEPPASGNSCVPEAVLFEAVSKARDRSLKWTNMDDQDLKLIRQIVASDGRKYTAGNIDRSKYNRLVDMGWLTPFKTNISDVEYQVTDKGRAASVLTIEPSAAWSENGLKVRSK
jgi:hypothetical protein